MNGDVLGDIVAAEKEIQQFLAAETTKAQERVERVRKEQEELLERVRSELEGESFTEGERIIAEAEAEAERILREKREELSRFHSLDDATLHAVVAPFIQAILPGESR